MDLRKEAQSFIHHLQILYFEQRDMDSILQMLDDHISWLGAGADEICRNKEEARFALEQELSEYSDGFRITKSSYETEALPGNIFIVYGSLCAVSNNPEIEDLHNHVSAVCKWTDGGMRLVHLNMSHPDENLMSGEYYVKHTANLNKEFLKRQIEQTSLELMNRNKELEALTDNIPGGVHQCLNDLDFTILNMSKSFLDLFGYTRDEVKDIFNNHFVEMIHPDDRDSVLEISKEQSRRGNTVEFEYRIQKKDGETLWILDRGRLVHTADGQETFYCLLLDITDRKKVEEELRLSLERHQVIMDQATDIIFEWDIRKDSLSFSSNWRKKFGYDPIRTDISSRIPYSDKIFGEDMPAFVKIMEDTAAGTPYSETEFRIMDIMGNKRWCRIRATTQYDGDNHPIKAIGIITDIDNDKKQKEQLMDMARKDALTGLYNKAAIQSIVEDQLCNGKKCSNRMLMIIDVDNFKSVNDTYGHLCGDSLLSDIANTLKKLFRSTDYIGRIGGDEFLIFLPDVAGREAATAKAMSVQTALERIRMGELAKGITCSIGISYGPQEADGYFKMYQEADRALYYMKSHGKSGFAFYEDFADKTSLHIDRAFSSINENIDSNAISAVDAELVQYTFRMLYNSVDIKTAVRQLFEIIGRAYDVSRVYIFENTKDGKHCSNTFEWCSDGVSSEMGNLQNLSYENELNGYMDCFDSAGIFYCRDIRLLDPGLYAILAPQGIVSLLQCAIMDDGVFKGFVGFDECRRNRNWNKDQIDSLILVANVLTTFLLKERLKEELARVKETCPEHQND